MTPRFKVPPRLAEILLVRFFPGALNLYSIVLVGRYLGTVEYGQFSLILATITIFVSVFIGPIEKAIVPLHARLSLSEGVEAFEKKSFGVVLSVIGLLSPIAFVVIFLGVGQLSWLLLFTASALSGVLLPILHARLQFWRYGVAATAKALAALILVALFLPQVPDSSSALLLYGVGVAVGAIVGWCLTGFPLPRLPDRVFLRDVIPVGTGLTLSTLAEAVLFVGTRYVIAIFGSPQFLGVFAFALDLAQRSVGILINITSFAIIPQAYVKSAQGDERMFRKMLKRAATVAASLSAVVFLSLMVLENFGIVTKYVGVNFSHAAFIAVSAAVVINRLKKLAIDPLLVSSGIIRAIPLAYVIVGPLSLMVIAGALHWNNEALVLIVYPMSYLFVALLTIAALRVISAKT